MQCIPDRATIPRQSTTRVPDISHQSEPLLLGGFCVTLAILIDLIYYELREFSAMEVSRSTHLILLLFFIITISGFFSPSAAATVFYLSPDGNDTDNCTDVTQPCLTLDYVLSLEIIQVRLRLIVGICRSAFIVGRRRNHAASGDLCE